MNFTLKITDFLKNGEALPKNNGALKKMLNTNNFSKLESNMKI